MEAKNNNSRVENNNNVSNTTVPPVPAAAGSRKEEAPKTGNGLITGIATGVGALVGAAGGSFAASAVNRPSTSGETADDADVEVLGYSHVNTEMDVVTVRVDGMELSIADTDMDGVADIAYSDINADGIITCDECLSIEGEQFAMADLYAVCPVYPCGDESGTEMNNCTTDSNYVA